MPLEQPERDVGRQVDGDEPPALRDVRRVLGVEAHLDRVARRTVPATLGRRGRRPSATATCSSTRSTPGTSSVTGCSTWRRVFISRKKNRSAVGVVEELDRARAAVADAARPGCSAASHMAAAVAAGQARGRGLLDDLLVAALHRAVAGAEGEPGAARVGDHLHLDVAPGLDVRLDEDGAVAEGDSPPRPRPPRSRPCRSGRGSRTTRMPRPPPPADAFTSSGRSASVGCSRRRQDRHARPARRSPWRGPCRPSPRSPRAAGRPRSARRR